MTAQEFPAFRELNAALWMESQPDAGRDQVLRDIDTIVPDGVTTPGHVFLTAVSAAGEPVGSAWLGLRHPRGHEGCAFLMLIAVDEAQRGRGYGRALLSAVERVAREHGATALELNVFGGNTAAISLYAATGYTVVTQQMRKPL